MWLLCSVLRAETFTDAQRTALWNDVQTQLRSHPRLVYHNGQTQHPTYKAFLVTNETAFPTMKIPAEKGDMQVGFATTINLNLLGARRNPSFVVADQSEEAVAAMMSLYRPLFLASPTPEAWIANLAGLPLRPGETLDQIFHRIGKKEMGSPTVLADLDVKLNALVKDGKITDVDRRFTLAALRDQIDPPPANPLENIPPQLRMLADMFGIQPSDLGAIPAQRVPVFRNSRNGTGLARSFLYFYSPEGRMIITLSERRIPEQQITDLLASGRYDAEMAADAAKIAPTTFFAAENYAHVQKVMADGGDHYAQTQIQDPKFWAAVGETARREGRTVTDVYLSNIPDVIARQVPELPRMLRAWVATLPGKRVTVYEAAFDFPHPFRTEEWTTSESGGTQPKKYDFFGLRGCGKDFESFGFEIR